MSVRTIEELKLEVPIEAVLDHCGATIVMQSWGENTKVFCPFHINENTPSGSMNAMKGVYHCFACGAGGSVIDLALLHLETESLKEACDWLEREFLDG